MTTTEMTRLLRAAATLLALAGAAPALASELPAAVDQPVLDSPASDAAQSTRSPADAPRRTDSATLTPGAPASQGASDDYRSTDQGEPKKR